MKIAILAIAIIAGLLILMHVGGNGGSPNGGE